MLGAAACAAWEQAQAVVDTATHTVLSLMVRSAPRSMNSFAFVFCKGWAGEGVIE